MTYTDPSVFLASKVLASKADKGKVLSTPSQKTHESSQGNKERAGRLRDDVSTSVIAPCICSGSVRVFDVELNIGLLGIRNTGVRVNGGELIQRNVQSDIPV